jgi:hypothetical protein
LLLNRTTAEPEPVVKVFVLLGVSVPRAMVLLSTAPVVSVIDTASGFVPVTVIVPV